MALQESFLLKSTGERRPPSRADAALVFSAALLLYVAVVTLAVVESKGTQRVEPSAATALDGRDSPSAGRKRDDLAADVDAGDDRSLADTMRRLFDARGFVGMLRFYAIDGHPSLEGVPEEEFDARVLAALRRRVVEEPERARRAEIDVVALDELAGKHVDDEDGFDPGDFSLFEFPLARELLPAGAGAGDPKIAARLDLIEDAIVDALDDPFTQIVRGGDLLGSMILELLHIPSELGVFIEPRDGGGFELGLVLRDSDAAMKGLRPGDRLLAVDGVAVDGLPRRQVQSLVAHPCRVTIARPGLDEALELEVRASSSMLVATTEVLLDGDVGYLAFPLFRPGSFLELLQAARRLERAGARAWILDLRGNPGGLLSEVGVIASLFLQEGDLVAEFQMRSDLVPLPKRMVSSRPAFPDAPLVVLIDRSSASAAEVLAAALDDHGRALLVGERTFGKGVGQMLFSFPICGREVGHVVSRIDAIALTMLTLRSPDGRDWHGVGLAPDMRAAPTDESRARMLRRARLLDDPQLVETLAALELSDDDVAALRAAGGSAPEAAREAVRAAGLGGDAPAETDALRDVLRVVKRSSHPELAACPELDLPLRKALAATKLMLRQANSRGAR